MTLKFYSQFTKEYLQELLSPLGSIEVSPDIASQQQRAIILFFPTLIPLPSNPDLGLLSSIVQGDCSLEVYSHPIDETEVLNCIRKLFSVFSVLQSRAEAESKTLNENELPSLWILVPSANKALLNGFGAQLKPQNWPCGVYFLPNIFRVAIVAIQDLPVTQETLWLRILGRGETQHQAISDLLALPNGNLFRQNTLKLITDWHIALVQHSDNFTPDERELIMNLSQVYQSVLSLDLNP
jgi:hypothetical protein